MASYYVFNLSYPTPFSGFLFFGQDMLMNHHGQERRDTKYNTYVASLNSAWSGRSI